MTTMEGTVVLRCSRIYLLLFVVLSLGVSPALAQRFPYQVDTHPSRGVSVNSDQLANAIDHIDPVTGQLNLQIPLASLPKGYAGTGFDLSLVYNSHIYDVQIDESSVYPGLVLQKLDHQISSAGWHYSFENYGLLLETRKTLSTQASYCTNNNDPEPLAYALERSHIYRLRLSLPDGSQHLLHLRSSYGDELADTYWSDGFSEVHPSGWRSSCAGNPAQLPQGTLTYYTTDGTYLRVEIPTVGPNESLATWSQKQWTLFYPDGRRAIGKGGKVDAVYDANTFQFHIEPNDATEGNRIYFEYFGDTVYIRDDHRRQMIIERSYTQNPRQDRITVPGPDGIPMEWRVNWQTFGINGNGPNDKYRCGDDGLHSEDCPLNFTHTVVQYVQLPLIKTTTPPQLFSVPPASWNSYEFQYDVAGYGALNFMRTPSGSTYQYGNYPRYFGNFAHDIADVRIGDRVVTQDSETYTWHWITTGYTQTTMTAPDGGQTVYSYYDPGIMSTWYRGLVYKIDEPNGRLTKRQWGQNRTFGLRESTNKDANNPFVQKESVIESGSRAAVTDFEIDKNGNLVRKTEHDWTAYNGLPNSVEAGGAILRETTMTYHLSVPSSTDVTDGSNRYWSPSGGGTAPRRFDAVKRRTVGVGVNIAAASEFEYDDAQKAGNLRKEWLWDSTKGALTSLLVGNTNTVMFERKYDVNGHGILTEILAPAVPTRLTYAGTSPYPTLVEYGIPGTSDYRSFSYSWDTYAINSTEASYTGYLDSKTDVQNQVSTVFSYDAAGRPKTETEAGLRTTATLYDDVQRTVMVKNDLASNGDGKLQTMTYYDKLGRVTLVRTSDGADLDVNGDSGNGVKLKTSYKIVTGGTHVITTTPYRSLTNAVTEALQWICTQKDQLGRVVAVATFTAPPSLCTDIGNRTGNTLTSYDVFEQMARTRVTDPAGKIVDRYSDGLGRLKKVVEDPTSSAFSTLYGYDVFDNLASVTQSPSSTPQCNDGVTQCRTFDYTSLGRLRQAVNPETGAIDFTYEDWGDVKTRRDERNMGGQRFTTTFNYDNLHRLASKNYSNDGGLTPAVAYAYHSTAPYVGRLQSVSSSTGSVAYGSYDGLGRVLTHSEQIAGGGTYNFVYSYWRNDALKTMQYPSGRLLNFDVDNAGRTNKVSAVTTTYANLTAPGSFTPDGRIAQMVFGNGLWETHEYRTPGTPTKLKLGSSQGGIEKLELVYNYSATNNNGNLLSHTVHQGNNYWSQSYGYDALNRLTCATENTTSAPLALGAGNCPTQGSWQQTYAYDRYGNRWVASSTGFSLSDIHEFVADTNIVHTTNRIAGAAYDLAGNLLNYDPWVMQYDAENRMLGMTSSSNGSSTFTYDGEGRRIKKVTTIAGSSTTYYVYDAFGKLAAEYSTQTVSLGTSYPFSDLLGTTRAVTSSNGTLTECSDYSPFGRLLQSSTRSLGCHVIPGRASQQFTGQVRDQETKIDYFGARYYSGAQGRFMSTDAPFADQNGDDPQSWNLYSYVRNKPLGAIDPDGHQMNVSTGLLNPIMLTPEQSQKVADFTIGVGKEWLNQSFAGTVISNLIGAPKQAPTNDAQRAGMQHASTVVNAVLIGASGTGKVGIAEPIETAVLPKVGEAGGPGAGKLFPISVKNVARIEAANKCVFCGEETARQPGPTQSNIDHAIPKSRGGNNTINNAQNTCRTCNLDKGARTTEEYLKDKR